MKKFSRLFLSGMLVTILGFGLAGCGSQKDSKDTASSSHTKTEKVTKKTTKKTSKNSKQNSTKKTSSTSSSASVTSSSQSSSSTANSNVNNNSQKQLGLNDVAVWTDQYGVTHHVDSDGMDRQTIAGSSQTNYQDWSGSLPSNAQIVKQN
ncbi:hypothetical protein KSL82_03030 [Limosilactobacillus portuensis]|jgi:uncharacterized lipoprotein YehR (DUF1307 family)|uniref:CDP-diacylglycerol diphosphatase n=1 Tax=Limosilactobacillus portuensis TaxID=2742601 RepID=A0ABS6ITP0_9LACO|nr:hypothetical protein [Limosilactobacillus portuensis]MBU9694896.1 hypothetical protein [Limosilactobacillus portuensis]MDU1505652.1 hypothetical protein [Limosilactobacillus vaginalis]PMC27954.1 hypothetical protein CJ225_03010 [Gardnerella vaginalis]